MALMRSSSSPSVGGSRVSSSGPIQVLRSNALATLLSTQPNVFAAARTRDQAVRSFLIVLALQSSSRRART
jgi:hypothetical protein